MAVEEYMTMVSNRRDVTTMTDDEIRRRQRSRNIAVALSLVAFVGIVFAVTIVRIQSAIDSGMAG